MEKLFTSNLVTFSLDAITGTFEGETFADNPIFIDLNETVTPAITDKDGNRLYGVDSTFGFYVSDFLSADPKELDGDYSEGHAGNILDPENGTVVVGISIKNAVTDYFRSGLPLGTWSLGLGGQTVKASTEHYATMAALLSDQSYPGDPDALGAPANDLRLIDLQPTGPDGAFEPGVTHNLYIKELTTALQRAIDNTSNANNP